MELKDCIIGMKWYAATDNPGKTARQTLIKNHKRESTWVLCQNKKPSKGQYANASAFALADTRMKGRVSAAAAFAQAVPNGILAEILPDTYVWVAASSHGLPIVGFDQKHSLDDAKAVVQQFLDSGHVAPDTVFVPEGFPQWKAEHQAFTFATLTASVSPNTGNTFRGMERGVHPLVWTAGGLAGLLVMGAVGAWWWQEREIADQRADEAAMLARTRAADAIDQQNALRHAAIRKALILYQTAMGRLQNAWRNGFSVAHAESVAARISRLAPAWGWRPVTVLAHGPLLQVRWAATMPSPDYPDFVRDLRSQGWGMEPNAYFTRISSSIRLPHRSDPLRVNPGIPMFGYWLNSLPVSWKPAQTTRFSPLPYQELDYTISGSGFANLAMALHLLSAISGVQVSSLKVRQSGWSLRIALFEQANASPVFSAKRNGRIRP